MTNWIFSSLPIAIKIKMSTINSANIRWIKFSVDSKFLPAPPPLSILITDSESLLSRKLFNSGVWPKSISQQHLSPSSSRISRLTSSIVAKHSVTSLAINNMFRGEINSIDNEQHDKLFWAFILLFKLLLYKKQQALCYELAKSTSGGRVQTHIYSSILFLFMLTDVFINSAYISGCQFSGPECHLKQSLYWSCTQQ